MGDYIQTTAAVQTPPCLQQKIGRTAYLVKVYFNANSSQSVEDITRWKLIF